MVDRRVARSESSVNSTARCRHRAGSLGWTRRLRCTPGRPVKTLSMASGVSMQRIVPLLPIALVLLAFAAAPSRPVNAQGSGQDPRFDDCVESVVYSILQAQHIEGGTIEADDVRGRNVEAAKTICLSMEQAGIMGDQPSDAIDTCTGLLLPDGATNDDARQVMIGCARAVIGRSAAPPEDPPLDMNVLA